MITKALFRTFLRLTKSMDRSAAAAAVAKHFGTDTDHVLELVDGWNQWAFERQANARYWR